MSVFLLRWEFYLFVNCSSVNSWTFGFFCRISEENLEYLCLVKKRRKTLSYQRFINMNTVPKKKTDYGSFSSQSLTFDDSVCRSKRPARNASTLSLYTRPDRWVLAFQVLVFSFKSKNVFIHLEFSYFFFFFGRQDQQTKGKQRIILAPTVDIDSLKVEIITVSSMRFNI